MTNTLPSRNGSTSPKRSAQESAVGLQKHKRTAIDIGLALITPIVGQEFLDKHNLRDPLNRTLKYGVKQVFSAAGASTRQFKRIQGLGKAPTRLKASGADYFDLTPDDDQKMILETVEEFAEEILRPAARDADDAASYPPDLITKAAELGITAINIPEDFDGIAVHRSTVTNARRRGARVRRHGPGPADPCARRRGVGAHPLQRDQQAISDRVRRRNVPRACVAIANACAVRPDRPEDDGSTHPERVPVERREVAGTRRRGCRTLHRRRATVRQARAVHRRVVDRVSVKTDPSMGIRGAALGRVELDTVSVPLSARLGEDGATDDDCPAIALARLGWAALAVGTAHAVLDHVVPYIRAAGVRRADRTPAGGGLHGRQHRHRTRRPAADHLARRLAPSRVCRSPARRRWLRLGTDKGIQISLDGVQLLGGYGFTKEHQSNAGTATCARSASPRAS
jgi:hypothetical protein